MNRAVRLLQWLLKVPSPTVRMYRRSGLATFREAWTGHHDASKPEPGTPCWEALRWADDMIAYADAVEREVVRHG